MDFSKTVSECAFHIKSNDVCLEDKVIDELKSFAENTKSIKGDGKTVIKKLKKKYNCTNESCLLQQTEIVNKLGHDVVETQLRERFKPEGPYDSNDWFSNYNIDDVLDQIEVKYRHKKFLHISFQMRDFEKSGGELSKIDLVQKYNDGVRCFGVVFNTDYSYGNGLHWFSIFGDLNQEPFTIEYFNSSGEEPLPEISKWMKDTRNKFKLVGKNAEDIVVTKIVNQKDNHSCGSYSLYYIISRLDGVNREYFTNKKIGDNLMHEFRKNYLFRKPT